MRIRAAEAERAYAGKARPVAALERDRFARDLQIEIAERTIGIGLVEMQ